MSEKNALAELAERLRNGLYINPSDKRFDGPVIVRTLDADDVLAAHRIVAELAKVRTNKVGWPEKLSIPLLDDMANLYAKCIAIAEEGAE